MTIRKRAVISVCVAVLMAAWGVAQAAEGGVGFSRNRLVYLSTDKATSLTIFNQGSTPYLVQAGVSADNKKNEKAPFVVTPPLFRLNGESSNVMRIIATGAALPVDRESVFYFHATTIPGQSKGKDDDGKADTTGRVGATVSVSMKTIMKLFWRPDGLPYNQMASTKLLHFIRKDKSVLVKNPTPYYQSFARLEFDGKKVDTNAVPSMVSPFSELIIPSGSAVSSVTWTVMNDYGGTTKVVTQKTE